MIASQVYVAKFVSAGPVLKHSGGRKQVKRICEGRLDFTVRTRSGHSFAKIVTKVRVLAFSASWRARRSRMQNDPPFTSIVVARQASIGICHPTGGCFKLLAHCFNRARFEGIFQFQRRQQNSIFLKKWSTI